MTSCVLRSAAFANNVKHVLADGEYAWLLVAYMCDGLDREG